MVSHTVKRVAKCGSSLEALGRIFGDGHQDNLIERDRKFGLKFDGWPRRLDHVSGHNGIVAALREGALAGHPLIKADASRIKFEAWIGGLPFPLLRRHVVGGAETRTSHSERAIGIGTGN